MSIVETGCFKRRRRMQSSSHPSPNSLTTWLWRTTVGRESGMYSTIVKNNVKASTLLPIRQGGLGTGGVRSRYHLARVGGSYREQVQRRPEILSANHGFFFCQ